MNAREEQYDVIVIGGGASGMMAAVVAGSQGKKVLVLEKNSTLGKKLSITGGGRCNITNAEYDVRALLSHYGTAAEFLHSPFSQFGVKDTFAFFESRGLPIKIEDRKRAFPVSEKASDVVALLARDLKKYAVAIKTNCAVKKIYHAKGAISGIETAEGIIHAKAYVLASGGMSHPETGSTGDGFGWLNDLGHTVATPTPTIVPVAVSDAWIHMLAGVTMTNMKITFFSDGKKAFFKKGSLLCTHFGISGPLILNSSRTIAGLLESGTVTALIDAFPELDHGALDAYIVGIFDTAKNKILKNVFKDIAPAGTAAAVQTLLPDIDFDTKVHSVSKTDRKRIVDLLKALPVTITHLMGYDRAVVADGGVMLGEIDMKSMRSKIYGNLYVTGDLLHINRPSGGYSLQLCWTTGYVAGMHA